MISHIPMLRGKTTSTGKVTGTARVVNELSQIGRVKQGEILIVHATDPGWTPVFMLIKGTVLETGGPISHGALRLIPDGATITLDGDLGVVTIYDETNEPGEGSGELKKPPSEKLQCKRPIGTPPNLLDVPWTRNPIGN